MSSFYGQPWQNPGPGDTRTKPPYPYGIPARWVRLEEDPAPHCNPLQVKDLLLGRSLKQLLRCTSDDAVDRLIGRLIQEVTNEVCQHVRQNFDWSLRILFQDGTGTNKITLPDRNIRDVTACFIRVLPSQVWYHFAHPRKVDGSEFFAIGSEEPWPPAAEQLPVNIVGDATIQGPIFPTGIEDADLLVDTRRRTIVIPPRVLYAGLSQPLWNYNFLPFGSLNIEIHYFYGYPPTKYLDGKPLTFDPTTGLVAPLSPGSTESGGIGTAGAAIDWSSGMPSDITMKVARIVANRIRTQSWAGQTGGVSSISVDGASESFGSQPYGGYLTSQDKEMLESLESHGIIMVI